MMRPYPGHHLDESKAMNLNLNNYRLSWACRVIENAFGILAARWCIFCRPIIAHPDHVILFTQAAIALHNYLRTTESSIYTPPGFVDGEDGTGNGNWRENDGSGASMQSVRCTSSSNRYNNNYNY